MVSEVRRQRYLAYIRELPVIVPPNCTELRKITPYEAIIPNIATNTHSKPRGVIVYLLVNEKNTPWFRSYVKELYYHLQDIWRYYNHRHDYPVIVFYDETVSRSDIEWLNRATVEQNVVFSDVTRVKQEFFANHVVDPDAYVRCMSNLQQYSLHSMNYVFMNYWRIKGNTRSTGLLTNNSIVRPVGPPADERVRLLSVNRLGHVSDQRN